MAAFVGRSTYSWRGPPSQSFYANCFRPGSGGGLFAGRVGRKRLRAEDDLFLALPALPGTLRVSVSSHRPIWDVVSRAGRFSWGSDRCVLRLAAALLAGIISDPGAGDRARRLL